MSDKFYTIKVGRGEPQVVLRGDVNKKTGLPDGKPEEGLSVMGGYAIPNYSKIWGKRELNKEGKPTGNFAPMEWGAEGGEILEIRFMDNCKSLDKRYQQEVGLRAQDKDAEIFLEFGINEFDYKTQGVLISMLKLHTANGDSPCRDKQNQFVIFSEYDEEKNISFAMKEDEILFDAMGTIMDAKDNPSKLRVLGQMFGIPVDRKDKLISTQLMTRLKANPLKFLEDKNNFIKLSQKVLNKANEFQLLDLSIAGEVRIYGDNEGPVITGLPVKLAATKKLDYMAENIMDPDIFEATEKIKKAVIKKEQSLN